MQALIRRLGHWPLALKLAGSAMRQRLERGETWPSALEYVKRALDKRGITAFDAARSGDPGEAVATTVGLSLDHLDPVQRQQCLELSVFPEDVAVPVDTVAQLWQCDQLDAEDLLRRLDDLALVELDLRAGAIQLHDTLRMFMAGHLTDPARVHARLIDAWRDPHALPDEYAWRHHAFHALGAGRAQQLSALLLSARWLDAKLMATSVHCLLADFDHPCHPVQTVVQDALRLSVRTRRLFDHLIEPAAERTRRPATEELLDTYLDGESVFDVGSVQMSASGRFAVLSAKRRDVWCRARALRNTDAPRRPNNRACSCSTRSARP